MASHPAFRHVASTAKSALGFIHVQCHVKPGASKQREGIISVTDSLVEICVSAQPRDGEANKAVRAVFSEALKCPKSDIEVVRGLKSREKTVAIALDYGDKGDENTIISKIREQLEKSVE